MQVIALILTIIGGVLAFIGPALLDSLVFGGIGTAISVIGAIFQYYVSRPFIKTFTENDWTQRGDQYILCVSASHHLRGNGISAKVYENMNGSSEVVICDEIEQGDGSFAIRASKPFCGKLVLK